MEQRDAVVLYDRKSHHGIVLQRHQSRVHLSSRASDASRVSDCLVTTHANCPCQHHPNQSFVRLFSHIPTQSIVSRGGKADTRDEHTTCASNFSNDQSLRAISLIPSLNRLLNQDEVIALPHPIHRPTSLPLHFRPPRRAVYRRRPEP